MSVVFDVLDSLNSIRNVEDLKKRWAEDCKRPQTQSYKAVEMFVDFFDNYSSNNCLLFVLRVANFTMRYREAVARHICPIDEQIWIMPYIRYAERLKAFVSYYRDFAFIPDDFAKQCYEDLHNTHCYLDAYYHIAFAKECLAKYRKDSQCSLPKEYLLDAFGKLHSIAKGGDEPDQAYCDLSNIVVPSYSSKDADAHNPWGLNPDPDEYYYDICHTDEINMATIYPYFGCPLLYDYDLYPESVSLESYLDKLISHLDSSKDLRNKDQADVITYMVSRPDVDDWTRLKAISSGCQNELPWNFEIILRYDIETVFVNYLKKELPTAILSHESDLLLGKVRSLKSVLPEDLVQYCYTNIFADLTFEAAIREDERKKVMFEISHSIKNLMASVSEPLDMLKDQLEGTQRRTVENALAGAGLIRDLAVGVHMSMRGEPGTWRKDVLEPGFGAATLDKIILDAVRHAVSNMFDGKYFAQFVKNYFGKDLNTFMQAQNEWKAAVSAEDTFACINKYFFDFKIDCGESSLNIPIGDRDGTATKLLILFQELFLNAVKYSSFTEREKRFVKLDIAITQKNWNIKLSNSAVGRQNAKSSGIGLAVIKNFADLFEAKYDASCKNDTYISNINFSLNK